MIARRRRLRPARSAPPRGRTRDRARADERAAPGRAAVRARARHVRRLVHQRPHRPPARRSRSRCPAGRRSSSSSPSSRRGKEDVPRGGVVRDPEVHRRVLREVAEAALGWGAEARAVVDSGLPGPKGNREFFLHLVHCEQSGARRTSSTAGSRRRSMADPVKRAAVITHGRRETAGEALERLEPSPGRRASSSSCRPDELEKHEIDYRGRARRGRPRRRARRRRHDAARAPAAARHHRRRPSA